MTKRAKEKWVGRPLLCGARRPYFTGSPKEEKGKTGLPLFDSQHDPTTAAETLLRLTSMTKGVDSVSKHCFAVPQALRSRRALRANHKGESAHHRRTCFDIERQRSRQPCTTLDNRVEGGLARRSGGVWRGDRRSLAALAVHDHGAGRVYGSIQFHLAQTGKGDCSGH